MSPETAQPAPAPPTPPNPPPAVMQVLNKILADGGGNQLDISVNWTYEGDYKDINNWVAHLSLGNTTVAMTLPLFLLFVREMVVLHDEAKRSGILGD